MTYELTISKSTGEIHTVGYQDAQLAKESYQNAKQACLYGPVVFASLVALDGNRAVSCIGVCIR